MANTSFLAQGDDERARGRTSEYTLYAANGRVYANNEATQKLIDLGSLSQREDGYGYLLDGNGMSGSRLPDPPSALREIGERIRFLFLDGQFTALADARSDPQLNLENAPAHRIVLDELQPGEPLQDATV
jgi:hypothetical protein